MQKNPTGGASEIQSYVSFRQMATAGTYVITIRNSLDYPGFMLWRHRLSHTSSNGCKVFHCDGNDIYAPRF